MNKPKFRANPKKFTSPVAKLNQLDHIPEEEPVAQLEESNIRKHLRNLRGAKDSKDNKTGSESQMILGKRRRPDQEREKFAED